MTKKIKISFMSVVLLVFVGCTPDKEIKILGEYSQVDLSNAIKIKEDLFYIPMGKDADNCTMHAIYSPTMMTTQGVIYQNSLNNFSMGKNPSTCL